MKKNIAFVFLLLIIVSSSLNAQLVRSYGFKIGGNLAKQDFNYASNLSIDLKTDNRFGLNVGAFIEFLDLPVASIIAEVDYTQKGMKYTSTVRTTEHPEGIGTTTVNNRIDYLSILLLGKVRYNLILFSPYLLAGPRVDIEINKNIDKNYDEVYKDFKKGNFGLTFGIGTEIIKMLLAEIRYNVDLTDAYSTANLKVKNQSIDFLVGIML
ncbi:MAG: porin family protein [Ignavibacteriales bacterium]|nr:porin family protein [Ignavibacteriales bacterium]